MNKYQRLIITVAIIDLIVILLFPPFVERTLAINTFPTFDGFYFLLSELGRRPIDKTLLSMELLWIAANALSAWLLVGSERRESSHAGGIGLFAFVNIAVICLFPPSNNTTARHGAGLRQLLFPVRRPLGAAAVPALAAT